MAKIHPITPVQFFRAVFVYGGVKDRAYDAAFVKAVEGGFVTTITKDARNYATRQRAHYREGRNPTSDYERD